MVFSCESIFTLKLSLYLACIASAIIEWITTYISGNFRLTPKYHSTFNALMKARLKQRIYYTICRI
jgi:hypothetical protein